MAEGLFCGLCHFREMHYLDKQKVPLVFQPGPPESDYIPLPVAGGRKDTVMRGCICLYQGIHLCKLFLLTVCI